jgi:hypothetical protein
VFDATSASAWLTKTLDVNLIAGDNTIQMELYWGWMYLDYLAVPTRVLTSVEERPASVPGMFCLEQNYPNPFNPLTVIKYTIAGTRGQGLGVSGVSLVVYDVLGREVAVLVNERKAPGTYQVTFDGSGLSSGVYFYRLEAGDFVQTKKLVLLK